MSNRSKLWRSVAVVLGMMLSVVAVTPASAAPRNSEPGHALYRGELIDLRKGWGSAQACVVFSASDTRCYASRREADAVLGYSPQTDPLVIGSARVSGGVALAAAPPCASGWLCLYENPNGGGRTLQFRDESWQQLSTWNFAGKTSSWRNNQGSTDNGHLSMYNSSSVYLCGARSYALTMGTYNDQAYAVWG